ncbi:M20 aminoacylase family protein [Oricola cellulosilytica]|uniref:Amidohydrolase n=1 Tax=Oricola cellulosilytica TaxID=1429082 RepID=A0A4R0PC45_9HYPH|nr:M20 aminoacylase family protein [Oricola cellulosilytica]TCD13738.1 amidohydrolase [Oricola cellulosilytica]
MPILNRAHQLQPEVAEWRRHLHMNPELLFDVHDTAAFVAEKLREFGCDEVATGIGRTGVVGVIKGARGPAGTIGLRADMDALPIREETGKAYQSRVAGKMHACGHDGHTAMLLGASKYLAETRNFAGTIVVIFQPAEEGGGGGDAMVKDSMMERFGIERVFGMHNMPGVPAGAFSIRPGPFFAATDEFRIEIKGKGGHAAMPHQTVDPIVAASQLVTALQTIASRNTDPISSIVVSVTKFNAGSAHNVIPETAEMSGTVRTLSAESRKLGEVRIRTLTEGIAAAHGAIATVEYRNGYPVTVNHEAEAVFAAKQAARIVGDSAVDTSAPPLMGGEDFSYMLEARPGAMILIGNGETAGLHHPAYDFNDEIIPLGISYWAALAEANAPA